MSVSVLLEGDTKIDQQDASWQGTWHFAKTDKTGVQFSYRWISSTLPRELLDYVSFIPSPNDPPPPVPAVGGRGRGRGRGRGSGSGRGGGRGRPPSGNVLPSAVAMTDELLVSSSSAAASSSSAAMMADGEEADHDNGGDDGDDDDIEGINADERDDDGTGTVDEGAMDVCEGDGTESSGMPTAAALASEYVLRPPVVIDRSHPLFGLWKGTFQVVKDVIDTENIEETFFFHSFVNQEPPVDLNDLPPEPLFSTLLLPRKPLMPMSASQFVAYPKVEGGADGRPKDEFGSSSAVGGDGTLSVKEEGGRVPTESGISSCSAEALSSSASTAIGGVNGGLWGLNEPGSRYLVGFGMNSFGRFSLSAVLNETTGFMRCEKKYMTSKGSGRRGRRPGSSSCGGLSMNLGAAGEGMFVPRPMSTRPRTSSVSSVAFYGSDDGIGRYGVHANTGKKRKSIGVDGLPIVKKLIKDKVKGAPPVLTAFQQQKEREREKERARQRELEQEEALERELDDSESEYRVAFLEEETGEVYEGGWHPYAQRRHGLGVCLYADGTMYEGSWVFGREHGRGQLMTGERHIIYMGEWTDGMIHGQGVYTFANGDKYAGDWREGNRYGKGEYTTADGCRFVGDWKDGKRHGKGIFFWADGSLYDGEWENDNRHGRGLLILTNGFRYDGSWVNNYMEGRGMSVFPGGQEYQGSYKAGLREGRGSIKFAPGALYEGRFREDRIDGSGTIAVTETMPGVEEGEVLIPIQIQADIRRIHLKAGFGADPGH